MQTMLAVQADRSSPSIRGAIDPRLVLSLAAVYLIWSSTYLAIKIAVVDLPPFLMASLRYAVAGLPMLLVAIRRGATWPTLRDWLRVLPIGALLFVGGNGFVVIAQLSVPSGGAAVVCATMPLWVGVLGLAVRGGERPTRREWLALVLGFAGILVLMGGPTLAGEPHHIALLLAAPLCWALGSILARRLAGPIGRDSVLLSAMEMLTGGLALFVVAAARGERLPVDASASSWLAMAYLVVFGSIVAFTAYSWLLRNARPVVATSYAFVNPILAVLLGALLSAEAIGVTTIAALVMIVGAIWLALHQPRRR